jgi:hypothetical protein
LLDTGLAFGPITGAVFAGNVLAGRLTKVAGTRSVIGGAALLVAASLVGLLVIGASSSYPELLAQALAVAGVGGAIAP